MSPRVRRILLRAFAVLIIGVVTWLFAAALVSGWDRVQEHDITIDGLWVAAAALFVLAVAASGFLWGRVLRALDPELELSAAEAVRSHLAAWVMRYIPGVGSLLYKIQWAQRHAISRTVAVVGFTYESIFLQIASIVGGAVVLVVLVGPALLADNLVVVIALAVLLAAMLLGASRPVVRPVLTFVARRKLRERAAALPLLSTPRSLLFAIEYLTPRVINGIGVAVIAVSVFGSGPRDWFIIGAAYAVAGALGILAVFVPGGLGVREGAFVGILTASGFNVVDAIVLAVAARFVSTVSDLLIAAVYGMLTAAKRRKEKAA